MNVYRDFSEIKRDEASVVTVGAFDGIHRGHQLIINRLTEIAETEKLRSVVVTFRPHPQIALANPNKKPIKILNTISERVKLFKRFGVEHVVIVKFDKEFARTDPEVFIRDMLFGQVGFRKILVGYDHNFGKDRSGNRDLLQKLGGELGFETEPIGPFKEGGEIISSTKIRDALASKNLDRANQMLGYNFFLDGTVVVGNRRGASLGFPTANVDIVDPNRQLPSGGVYLVRSEIDGETVFGMANLGRRPTFTNDLEQTLEVHFFDFDQDIYGKEISVHFLKYVREERKFASKDDFLNRLDTDRLFCLDVINKFYK